MALLKNNSIKVETKKGRSNPIKTKCGVPQGGPLSPILFDIATNFIYEDLCASPFANCNGFKLVDGFDALCVTGFADDNAVTSSSIDGARRVVEMMQSHMEQIGLSINPQKSAAIHIQAGNLVFGELQLGESIKIKAISDQERIRYLGCN